MTLPAASFTEHPDIAASLAIAGLKTTPGEEEASLHTSHTPVSRAMRQMRHRMRLERACIRGTCVVCLRRVFAHEELSPFFPICRTPFPPHVKE